jgi:hypothetical protein
VDQAVPVQEWEVRASTWQEGSGKAALRGAY